MRPSGLAAQFGVSQDTNLPLAHLNKKEEDMKIWMPIFLGAALAVGCAAPTLARPNPAAPQYQGDQESDRQRNTQAYSEGYAQGQDDARGNAIRNDRPTAQWTKDDDRQAYREGYNAGFDDIRGGSSSVMAHGNRQAQQFGYDDGLAAGRQDRRKGNKFNPQDHDLYKSATHGWTAELGTPYQFKQLYRESYVKGYEEGYRGD